jgi:hypothetical protein
MLELVLLDIKFVKKMVFGVLVKGRFSLKLNCAINKIIIVME